MKPTALPAVALLLAASTGCTGATGNDDPEARVVHYQELARQVESAAIDYHSQMMGQSGMDPETCQYVHDLYYDKTGHFIIEMGRNSLDMDETMHMFGANAADHACVSAAMWKEFAHHHSVACSDSGLSENLAEVQRHVEAMNALGAHLQDRCDDMMAAFAGTTPDWAPLMAGCEDTFQAETCDATHSGMMHGGMMHDEDCD